MQRVVNLDIFKLILIKRLIFRNLFIYKYH